MHSKMEWIATSLLSFIVISSCGLSSLGSKLNNPNEGGQSVIPKYPSLQEIVLEQDDLQQFILDSFGSDSLQSGSKTDLSWTEDEGKYVFAEYFEMLPEQEWSMESEWEVGYHYMASEWTKDDSKLYLMILYELDSESLSNLESFYGIAGIDPGGTLVCTHVVDLSQTISE